MSSVCSTREEDEEYTHKFSLETRWEENTNTSEIYVCSKGNVKRDVNCVVSVWTRSK